MKNEVFFGENGITSTSANTIANIAKEYIQSAQTKLDNIQFYQTSLNLIGESNSTIIEFGINEKDFKEIPNLLAKIALAKSLIAWLREAIKAKEELVSEHNRLTLENFCKINNIPYPKIPEGSHILTEKEYYDSLDIKSRNRYYQLETQVAVIGKYIHPNGYYAEARKTLKNKINNPVKVSESGRDTLIFKYNPSIKEELVETQFYMLQQKHRDLQKQLNSMKFECEKAIEKSESENATQYKIEADEYRAEINRLNAAFKVYQIEQNAKLRSLKIVIPDSLQNIFKEISSLGK